MSSSTLHFSIWKKLNFLEWKIQLKSIKLQFPSVLALATDLIYVISRVASYETPHLFRVHHVLSAHAPGLTSSSNN